VIEVAEVAAFGGPEALRTAERPDPVAGTDEVVVRIHAANVNPTDLAARSGQARARMPDLEPPFVPGWDLAGEVTSIGPGVHGLQAGDRVAGMIPWGRIGGRVGAYAEAAAVEAQWLVKLPDGVGHAVASTLPLNALTARQALDLIGAAPGATLLVTGASGAVGGFAVQLAVRDGLRVLAVASNDDEEWVAGLGPAEVLPRSTDLAGLEPVDAVLDAVPIGPELTAPLRDGGVAVFTRPPDASRLPAGIRAETILVQPDQDALRKLVDELAAARLQTRIAELLPLAEAGHAHALVEAGGLRGKLVLAP
jgi:NADPH:quinone reductase-like Zn-dependent oxidoreductase